jgi:hypothetical protein
MGVLAVGLRRPRARDGRRHFGSSLEEYARRGLLAQLAKRLGMPVPPLTDVSDAKPLPAFVHHDRWVAQCECGDVQFVWLEQPLFLCSNCWNKSSDYRWRRVSVPKNAATIDAILGHRRDYRDRSWLPGLTVAALRRQNIANGDPIPVGG